MITANTPVTELPNNVETLKEMVLRLLANVDDLNQQLAWFKRHVFGRRSEKLDPAQRLLFEGLCAELESKIAAEEKSKEGTETPRPKNANHHGRCPLPDDLPRQRIEYHPEKEELICSSCGKEKQAIGEEITEQLDYVPASFVVRQHVRIKYACPNCRENVSIAELPVFPIDKGRPGTGLLAHIITSKYADHLPLNRQENIFGRHDVDIRRSTMCDWVGQCAGLLEPIVKEMKRQVLKSPKIHTDDTTIPVQCRDRKGTYDGYLWVYADMSDNVVFDFTPTRCRDGPINFLGGYSGYIQADAYKGYDKLFAEGGCTEVGCWAHCRRKFDEAIETDKERAGIMLALIGRLYDVERDAKERKLDAEGIKLLRQEKSKPVLEEIRKIVDGWSLEVLPKSPIGKAINYALGQWKALNRYIENGILSIDNNLSERLLRAVVLGRKNWLFAGNENGATRAAIIYSLVASCKLCDIDPFEYFRDVLECVSTHPNSRIAELTPPNWKKLHLESAAAANRPQNN